MRVDLYREATLSRASPLAQEPFSKHVRTKKSSYCGETLSQASPLAQEPFSKHLRTRVCALMRTTRRRFLGQPLSHKSLSQRTLSQRRAGPHTHSYYGEALSRASPLAQEPFSKHSWTKGRQRLHSCLVAGQKLSRATPLAKEPFSKHPRTRVLARAFTHIAAKCFIEQLLSHNGLSPSTLGQRGDSDCAQSFTLQGFLELPLSHGRLSQGPLGKIV